MLWVLKRDSSFEHPKHMFNLMDKKIIIFLLTRSLLIWTYICIPDSDEEMDIDFSDAPEKPASEPVSEYFERTKDYWVGKAKEYCASEQMTLSTKKFEKLAGEMCQEAFDSWYYTSMGESFQDYSWIQDFEADFHRKSASKIMNLACYNSISHLFSVSLKTIDHLNWKLLLFCRNVQGSFWFLILHKHGWKFSGLFLNLWFGGWLESQPQNHEFSRL